MIDNRPMNQKRLCFWLFFGILLMSIAFLLSSCKSVRFVPVESVKSDSIYINKILHDSVYQRDSIYVERTGDTTYIYRDKYIYKYKNLTDTLFISQIDTVRVPCLVEKELSGWKKLEMYAGATGIGILMTVMVILLLWMIYAWKKR